MARTELLILSDSHGRADAVEQALKLTRPHLLLFCGDGLRDLARLDLPCPLYAVRGNCDYFSVPSPGDAEDTLSLTVDGMKLLLTHGHRYGVKGGLGHLIAWAVRERADAVIFGHTHEPLDMTLLPENTLAGLDIHLEKPLHLFNPGAIGAYPSSFGTLTLQNGVPLFGHGALS